MNDRYIDSMAYLLVDSVTGHTRRKAYRAQRSGRDTKIIALKRSQNRSKVRVSKSRWEDLWQKLFGEHNHTD